MFEAPIAGNEQIAVPKLREKKTPLSPLLFATRCGFVARSLFRNEKFQEKPLGQG